MSEYLHSTVGARNLAGASPSKRLRLQTKNGAAPLPAPQHWKPAWMFKLEMSLDLGEVPWGWPWFGSSLCANLIRTLPLFPQLIQFVPQCKKLISVVNWPCRGVREDAGGYSPVLQGISYISVLLYVQCYCHCYFLFYFWFSIFYSNSKSLFSILILNLYFLFYFWISIFYSISDSLFSVIFLILYFSIIFLILYILCYFWFSFLLLYLWFSIFCSVSDSLFSIIFLILYCFFLLYFWFSILYYISDSLFSIVFLFLYFLFYFWFSIFMLFLSL